MLQNRTWIDRNAEAEFWRQMERFEILNARKDALGPIEGLFKGGPFRRAALQRDLDAIRNLAQDLLDRHTVPADAVRAPAPHAQASTVPTLVGDPLRTLAGMMVSLRQDRTTASEDEEQSAV